MLEGFADLMLRMLGENPAAYPGLGNKLPAITGILSYYIIPYGLIVAFILPFIIIFIIKRKFTKRSAVITLIVGITLVILAYALDWIILNLGQTSLFYDLYSPI